MKGALTMGEDAKLMFDEPDAAEEQDAAKFEETVPKWAEVRLEVPRPLAEGERSIAKWAEGDPARAMQIATRICEDRYDLLWMAEARVEEVEHEIRSLEERIAALRSCQEGIRRARDRRLRLIDGLLAQYQLDFYESQRTKAGNLKTALPYGVEIERTQNKPKRVWRDEKAALAWAMDSHRDAVRIKYELDKKAALAALEEQPDGAFLDPGTGEVVEFVVMEPPDEPESVVVKQSIEAPPTLRTDVGR